MNLPLDIVLQAVTVATAFCVCLQSLELLILRKQFSSSGYWPWSIIGREYKFLSFFLSDHNFLYLLITRLLAAMALAYFAHVSIVVLLLVCQLLIGLRWRGHFNGGSDYMTTCLLVGLCFGELGLYYIAVNLIFSYFVAGVVKLKSANWRSGAALQSFSQQGIYGPIKFPFPALFSWVVILFECSFPLAIFVPQLLPSYLSFAFIFHICNWLLFGLNRFVWAWLAAYPALLILYT